MLLSDRSRTQGTQVILFDCKDIKLLSRINSHLSLFSPSDQNEHVASGKNSEASPNTSQLNPKLQNIEFVCLWGFLLLNWLFFVVFLKALVGPNSLIGEWGDQIISSHKNFVDLKKTYEL